MLFLFFTFLMAAKPLWNCKAYPCIIYPQFNSHRSDLHLWISDLGKQCFSYLGTGVGQHWCKLIFKHERLLAAPWSQRRGSFGSPGVHQDVASLGKGYFREGDAFCLLQVIINTAICTFLPETSSTSLDSAFYQTLSHRIAWSLNHCARSSVSA